MQVITPIHHPLIAPDGRLALHHFLSGEASSDWEPRILMVDLLQMFRQQLLVTDYDHVRETCDLVEPLAEAVDRWTADGAGQARKAAAMTALFAMTDTERAKRWPNWADAFASLHPQYGREVRTLVVLASRNSHELQCSTCTATTTLSDLPLELVAMIADRLLLLHMADLARSLALPSFFGLPPDWRTRVITTPP
ncbi:uncharacterized protein ACA1_389650 [Acanthamoeba castellanii str. Neff]|uniref:Uncharacterized protein n=1 Tax=Acanthamoeba castellanii (strain ATCC 30010 / Neff) TaxID=1257118 RepID=L8GEF5_ACACF|nr:uncharacterized protein ACA1_389650 [Acanthamoeba castellanii str. Neff]ELR11244.1 hypothetical protein ACA1_389650 [Acanthamoeba castellanii str. Neff]